jgi:hypothetical protein
MKQFNFLFQSVLALGVILVFSYTSCKKESLLPSCVQKKIEIIKSQPKWNPAAQVDEYLYNGKTVYGFTNNCCDQYYEVFDAECNYICAPSGGITGRGDNKCTDFQEKAQFVRVVWKDER